MEYGSLCTLLVSACILIGSSLGSVNRYDELAKTTNNTTEPASFTFVASGVTYQKVTGSTDGGPPWGAKFTPLSDASFPLTISRSVLVAPGKTYELRLYMNEETGQERWSDTVEINTVQRNRHWDTNVAAVEVLY